MTKLRYLAVMARGLAALILPNAAAAGSLSLPQTIAWGSCPEAWTGMPSPELGERLQCGAMTVPLDHLALDGRMTEVGVIRVRAAIPAQREGAIFFNKGGPGSHPGKLLRSTATIWATKSPDDPDDVDKRRLSERYDLVAVIPRGLVGSSEFRCVTSLVRGFAFLPTHLDDDNWNLAVDEAQSIVDTCSAPEQARYINTEQHVHDMDMLRRSLGDARLHFYGISYGGMVGAWYAATYPDHVGRMLLDSTMDFMHDYRTATRAALEARYRTFTATAVTPLLDNAARYGLGSADDVATSIDNLPARIREVWAERIYTPPSLAAALHVASWLQNDNPPTLDVMARLIERSPTSTDVALDSVIRLEALRLAADLYAPPNIRPALSDNPARDSVRTVVPCNDLAWTRSEQEIRATARENAARYINTTGEETLDELVCTRWGGPSARAPDYSQLDQAPPFLLVQSERDGTTPLSGASGIIERFANARMLLVRHADLHGVFNFTRSGCIERTAAHYLLTGTLPGSDSRVLACDGTHGNPLYAMPGAPRPAAGDPVPVEASQPPGHDEL